MGVVAIILLLWGSTKADRGSNVAKRNIKDAKGGKAPRQHKLRGSGNVDAQFIEKIKGLLKITVPSYNCKESKYLVILTLLLILRTQMSIWLADVNGRIVKSIVERNFSKFCYRVSTFNELLIFTDFQPYALFYSIVCCKLRNGVLFQITIGGFPREDYRLLP